MQKRIVSRTRPLQDICFFCASRPSTRFLSNSNHRLILSRSYRRSHFVQSPANAAALRDEDDGNDADNTPQERGRLWSLDRSVGRRHFDRRPSPSRDSWGQGSTNRAWRPSDADGSRQMFQNDTPPPSHQQHSPHQPGDRRPPPRSFGNHVDSRERFGIGREGASRGRGGGAYRGRPQNFDMQGGNPFETQPRFGRDTTREDRGQAVSTRSVRIDTGEQNTRWAPFGHASENQRATEKPADNYIESSRYYQGRGGFRTDRGGRRGGVSEETTFIAGSVPGQLAQDVGERQHDDGSSSNRTLRQKKNSRGDRFEVQIEAPSAQAQDQSRKGRQVSRGRGQDFDFEMMEAEQALSGDRRQKKKPKKARTQQTKSQLALPEFISVEKLAQSMKVKLDDLLTRLEEEGFEGARYDHILDLETSAMFADMYGFETVSGAVDSRVDLVARPPPEDVSVLPPRPPIVTIMGHVDHGKTTILDWLRKSSVASGEHGGITQHIGAFSFTMPGSDRQITFLDTPGHAAFLDMRRRGANVTDIVVLVVAADDSVKPQTIEAIKHALEANVQIIVAINKVDKDDANVERVKQDLTRHEIVVEDYGGDYQAIPVSGKTGQGMDQLEEAILTLSDVLDLRAEQDGPAEGTIIESKVTAAGRVATVLVRRGTLRPGDFIVAGNTWARVRTLRNDAGALVDEAPPGSPVQVDGWRGTDPAAGLEVLQAENEEQAKEVIELRLDAVENLQTSIDMTAINSARSQEADARAATLASEAEEKARRRHEEGFVEASTSSGPKRVHFVIKADVAGSVEALAAAVSSIGNNEVVANVIHSATGELTQSDIRILATTGETGYAISFNQPIDGSMYALAEAAGLTIMDHNIIYKVTDQVKEKLSDHLPPIVTQRVLGEAEIGQVFEVSIKKKKVKVAGCRVTNGTISRSNKVRVVRNTETVYTGTLDSLKNVKKDVTEMRKGTECGMGFVEWEDFQEGDQIQCFEEKEEKRKLY